MTLHYIVNKSIIGMSTGFCKYPMDVYPKTFFWKALSQICHKSSTDIWLVLEQVQLTYPWCQWMSLPNQFNSGRGVNAQLMFPSRFSPTATYRQGINRYNCSPEAPETKQFIIITIIMLYMWHPSIFVLIHMPAWTPNYNTSLFPWWRKKYANI